MTDPQQPNGFPPAPPSAPAVPAASGYPGAATPAAPVAPSTGYTAPPSYAAPGGAYQVPVGGYAAPSGSYGVQPAPQKRSSLLGILALLFSAIAAVIVPIVGGIAAYAIGYRLPSIASELDDIEGLSDWSALSPVRDQVLWAELSFWAGTLLGLAALVMGIIAIVQRRGRGQGIAAAIIAVIAPIIYFVVVYFALVVGAVEAAASGVSGA